MPYKIETIDINTEFIRLDGLLKFSAEAGSGGEAKNMILDGQVKVNDEICLQRTRKLHNGDIITVNEKSFLVHGAAK